MCVDSSESRYGMWIENSLELLLGVLSVKMLNEVFGLYMVLNVVFVVVIFIGCVVYIVRLS